MTTELPDNEGKITKLNDGKCALCECDSFSMTQSSHHGFKFRGDKNEKGLPILELRKTYSSKDSEMTCDYCGAVINSETFLFRGWGLN